jgi:hypothetical protein
MKIGRPAINTIEELEKAIIQQESRLDFYKNHPKGRVIWEHYSQVQSAQTLLSRYKKRLKKLKEIQK